MDGVQQKFLAVGRRRALKAWSTVACTVILGALLTATLYWTLFDARWVAFLGGVVFAAVLALVSQASKTQWALTRRTRQLARARAAFAELSARSDIALGAFRQAKMQLETLADALPGSITFIDREERCHHFNRELKRWSTGAEPLLEGCTLKAAVGEGVYEQLRLHLTSALAGSASCGTLSGGAGPYPACRVSMLPCPAGEGASPPGVLVIFEPYAPGAAGGQGEERADHLYAQALNSERAGWDEPQARLAAALREDQFLLLAQSIVPLKSGLPGPIREILLRLREEEDNLLPPGSFFPVAERYGMMESLDRWVVRNVVSHALALKAGGAALPVFSINLAAASVASHGFLRYVQQQLHDRSLDGASLCFEIAARDVPGIRDELRHMIATLKPLGCRFAVDDFGGGTAAFAPLQGLGFDFAKIDGSIVQALLRGPAELARARAIAGVCAKLGMRTIAEFVEDDRTLAALRGIGVDYVQGFGVARPEPLAPVLRAAAARR